MQTLLKIGGLVFSAGLTLSLFARLFGLTPFGLLMALAALALFEGGAAGWAHLLKKGREAQRFVAGTCLVIAVSLSLFSSGAEIVMATRFGAEALKQLDFPFLTLLSIVLALSTNVIGALAFEAMHPETRRAAEKLSFEGRLADMQYKAKTKIMDDAETENNLKVDGNSRPLALMIAERAYNDTESAIRELSAPRGKPEVTVMPDSAPYQLPSRPVRQNTWSMAESAVGGGADYSQREVRRPVNSFHPSLRNVAGFHANGPTASTGNAYQKPAESEKMEPWPEDAEAPKAPPRQPGGKEHHAPTATQASAQHSQTPPPWLKHTL